MTLLSISGIILLTNKQDMTDMKQLRGKRKPKMLPELVLTVLVLSIVGVALYQSNHEVSETAVKPGEVLISASTAADLTLRVAQQGMAADKTTSEQAEAVGDEFAAASAATLSLGSSVDANSF